MKPSLSIHDGPSESGKAAYADAREEREAKPQELGHDVLFDQNLDLLCLGSFDGRLEKVNPAWTDCLGWEMEELQGKPWLDFVYPDDWAETLKVGVELTEGKRVRNFENRYVCKDGGVKWLSWSSMPLMKTRQVYGAARDVTERRKNEEHLRLLEACISRLNDAILITDASIVEQPGPQIIFVNEALLKLSGYTREEILGQTPRILQGNGTNRAELDRVKDALKERKPVRAELLNYSKAGKEYWIEVNIAPVDAAGGEAPHFVSVGRDITERKLQEQQFLRTQRMESIGTLAGGIAHDLNNVLTPVMMSIELLKINETDPMRLRVLDTIETSTKRGADMVKQVLTFARGVEGDQLEVNLGLLLREVEKITNETFLKNISVRCMLDSSLWMVRGDPTQLHQVLINLCVNARDAMPEGGRVTVNARNVQIDPPYVAMNLEAKAGPYVEVQVEDTGTGMSPETIERIFEPFYTTKEVGRGTGLGLSTTLAIIKGHGGFVNVYSQVGVGTKFQVYLPAMPGSRPTGEVRLHQDLPCGHGELVLVVDDEAAVRQITQQTLETYGYRVLTAADGVEATALFAKERQNIAVVLTDMMMPNMDGATLIPVLLRINPEVKIVAASGLNTKGMAAKAMKAGVKLFVTKPYTAEMLLKTLNEVLVKEA